MGARAYAHTLRICLARAHQGIADPPCTTLDRSGATRARACSRTTAPKRKVAARHSPVHTPLFAESADTAPHSAALRRVHPSLFAAVAGNLQTGLLSHIMWYEIGSHSEK